MTLAPFSPEAGASLRSRVCQRVSLMLKETRGSIIEHTNPDRSFLFIHELCLCHQVITVNGSKVIHVSNLIKLDIIVLYDVPK